LYIIAILKEYIFTYIYQAVITNLSEKNVQKKTVAIRG
jgi:hypothetical protein